MSGQDGVSFGNSRERIVPVLDDTPSPLDDRLGISVHAVRGGRVGGIWPKASSVRRPYNLRNEAGDIPPFAFRTRVRDRACLERRKCFYRYRPRRESVSHLHPTTARYRWADHGHDRRGIRNHRTEAGRGSRAASEETFRLLYEYAAIGITELTTDGRIPERQPQVM